MSDSTEPLSYLGSLIRRAQQRHVAIWNAEVSSEITSVQFAALAVLAERRELSQRELGDELDVDRSTVADLVSRLVRNGFVTRTTDPVDARRYVLELSDSGRVALNELGPRVADAQVTLAAALSAEDAEQLRELLQRVVTDTP